MVHRFMTLPSFVWEVQNAYSFKKQSSPIFTFIGAKWMLELHHCISSRGQLIQITLKRISPDCTNPFSAFGVNTSLAVGTGKLCCENNISFFRPNEWRVWEESTNDIKKHVSGSTLPFFFSIQPKANISSVLYSNIDKEIEASSGRANTESLHEDLGYMFDQPVKADVIFKCRGELIYAHRAILSSRSQVFATMLQDESQENPIDITDTEPSIFRLFLRYLYTGDLPALSLDSAVKIYFLAYKHGMEILRRNTVFFLMDTLENDNSEGTSQSSDADSLETKIRHYLRDIKGVLCTENLKHMDEVKLKMFMDAFHFLVKYIYTAINFGEEITSEEITREEIIREEIEAEESIREEISAREEIDLSLVKQEVQEVQSKKIKLSE